MFANGRIRRGGSLVTASSRILFPILTFAILVLCPRPAPCSPPTTLDDLKKLEIICYVPSWLPKGFRLRSVTITYDKPCPGEDKNHRLPLYSIEYGNGPTSPRDESGRWADRTGGATFTIESAREGIGDRNIMETEDSEETQIRSPFGPMYLIYTPKNTASSGSGRIDDIQGHPKGEVRGETKFVKRDLLKVEIKANWAADPNMKREYGFKRERLDRGPERSPGGRDSRGDEARQNAKNPRAHPILGRYHGFSATAITVAEFEKIISSLKPIRP